jgi:general secretion pathway protein M
VIAFLIVIGIPAGMQSLIVTRHSDNEDLRAALAAVQGARTQVRERQARKDSIALRYAKKVPALGGYLETAARAEKLEITDSVDRPDLPHGKKYVERTTTIHLKKAGMLSIARFLESLEKSGMPLSITRLNIRKRSGEPDSYDSELGISAYDRIEHAADTTDKPGDKAADGKDKKTP